MSAHEERETIDIFQCHTCTTGNAVKRVFCNVEGDVYLISQTFAQTAQECSATAEIDTVLHDVSVKLWRCVLKSREYGTLYLSESLVNAVGNLLIA